MPCQSDYLNSTDFEKKISRVACLLDELDGKIYSNSDWDGYHNRVYGKVDDDLANELVAELCSRLQNVEITNCSLEMQIWWRDHQKADKERIEKSLRIRVGKKIDKKRCPN